MRNLIKNFLIPILILPITGYAANYQGEIWYSGDAYSLHNDAGILKKTTTIPNTRGDVRVHFLPSGNIVGYSTYVESMNNRFVNRAFFSTGTVKSGYTPISALLTPNGTIAVSLKSNQDSSNYSQSPINIWANNNFNSFISNITFSNSFKPQLTQINSVGSAFIWGSNINFNSISKDYFTNKETLLSPDQRINKGEIIFSPSHRYSITFSTSGKLIVKDGTNQIWSHDINYGVEYIILKSNTDGLMGFNSNDQPIQLDGLSGVSETNAKLTVSNTPNSGVLIFEKENFLELINDIFYGSLSTRNNNCLSIPGDDVFLVYRSKKSCTFMQF